MLFARVQTGGHVGEPLEGTVTSEAHIQLALGC